MNAADLYEKLDDPTKDQLKGLAEEISEKYNRGDRQGQYRGRVILFLGAAANFHAPAGFETAYSAQDRPLMAGELCEKYVAELFQDQEKQARVKEERLPLSWITQYYEERHDRRGLIEQLSQHIDGKKVSPILRALARMPFKYILSTNYDTLFEDALLSLAEPKICFKGIYKPNKYGNFEYTPDPREKASVETPFVYKLHGDIKDVFDENGSYIPARDAIVLTDDDYLHFILRMSQNNDNNEREKNLTPSSYYPIPDSINKAFTGSNENTFLFIGYGLKDYNLRLILKTALWQKDSNILRAVKKWSIDFDPDPTIKNIWINNFRLTFIEKDIWCVIPYLYKILFHEEMPL